MSTFGGKIQELPNISVDRFDGENFESEAYFLSHCHSDHMRGLGLYCFQEQLVEKGKYLYASQISCAILKRLHPYIKNNVKELDLNIAITILLENKKISVTLIPAGHCPGSVMFLFENGTRILYTGDYRISKNDIKRFDVFYDQFGKVKIIDTIYLDTTFFLTKYLHFPKREESLQELIQIIKEWTDNGKLYYISLRTSAKYGYEYVFNEIFNKLNMPVHVGEEAYRFYSLIPEMDKSVTLDGFITPIHSNCDGFGKTCIYYAQDLMVKTIRVSAFRWTQDTLTDGMSEIGAGEHYICYSTHASYEEGVSFIRFLKPRQIEICVKHDDPNINKEMSDLIEQHLEEFKTNLKEEILHVPKLFETENVQKKRKNNNDGFFGILDSPPREDVGMQKANIFHNMRIKEDLLKNTQETKYSKSEPSSTLCMEQVPCPSFSSNKSNFKPTSNILNNTLESTNNKNSVVSANTNSVTKYEDKTKNQFDMDTPDIFIGQVPSPSFSANITNFKTPSNISLESTRAQTKCDTIFNKNSVVSLNSNASKNKTKNQIDQDNPENILYDILNSSSNIPQYFPNISSSDDEDEEAKILIDIINSRSNH